MMHTRTLSLILLILLGIPAGCGGDSAPDDDTSDGGSGDGDGDVGGNNGSGGGDGNGGGDSGSGGGNDGTGGGGGGMGGDDGGGDGGTGGDDVCAIATGCFHEVRVMNGDQPACNGSYDGPLRVTEDNNSLTEYVLTGYDSDPSCATESEAEPPACETVVACIVGMGEHARAIRLTVEDADHASLDYQEVQDGDIICHITSEYERMDEIYCP